MSAISSDTPASTTTFTPDDIINAMLAPRARIDVWSHGCRISKFGTEIRTLMIELCRQHWAEYATVRVGRFRSEKKIKRVFVGTNSVRDNFHFHRNQLDFVLNRLGKLNIGLNKLEVVYHDLYEPAQVDFPLLDTRPPRDIQVPVIDYVLAPPDPKAAPSKVVTLQTGKGKTFLGLYCIRKLAARAVMVLPGKYIDQWIKRIEEAYGAEPGSLMVVRGMPQLRAVMDMAVAGTFKPRVLIISSKTMFMYLKYYEQNGVDEIVPIAPMDLYRVLGVGIRLIDEVHEDFHCNFRQDLYTHIPLTLSLSATLEPDQRILQEMFNIVWPPGTWAPEMPYHKFIAVKALLYRIRSLNGIRWLNFLRQYSHAEFEKSILKSPTLLSNYTDMIIDITRKVFVEKMEPGQKLLIFVARVELATLLADLLAGTFPKLLVNRYVSEDEFEELLAADISVSTLQSAGTAVDIPNLRITLMTTALSNKSSNIQALGRTRPLEDWPDVTPEFYFLAAMDIDKHLQYCEAKKEKLSGKVLSFDQIRTQYIV